MMNECVGPAYQGQALIARKWIPAQNNDYQHRVLQQATAYPAWLTKGNFSINRRRHMPKFRLALAPAMCLWCAGCVVSIPSEPGAENVILTHKEADVASCTALGNVVGVTDTNYVRDQRREMQNQAVGLGGDTLLLAADRDPPKGTAYRCKPAATEKNH
jgi:hypothetical protein